jgi:hypothetical protein
MAHDRDIGENARLRYSLHGTNLFEINAETGTLTAIQPVTFNPNSHLLYHCS